MSCKHFLGCNIFRFHEFQISVGFGASHLLSAVSEGACSVFPAGLTSSGILIAALTGGEWSKTRGRKRDMIALCTHHQKCQELLTRLFNVHEDAAEFGCEPRAASMTHRPLRSSVIAEAIHPPALGSRAVCSNTHITPGVLCVCVCVIEGLSDDRKLHANAVGVRLCRTVTGLLG